MFHFNLKYISVEGSRNAWIYFATKIYRYQSDPAKPFPDSLFFYVSSEFLE